MKYVSENVFYDFLSLLEREYQAFVPLELEDHTRVFGAVQDERRQLRGGKLSRKPTSLFFPQFEKTVVFNNKIPQSAMFTHKPLFIVGLTAQDAACLEFIDRFFSANFYDDIYFEKRKDAVVVCVTGFVGENDEFLKISGRNCDIEMICDKDNYFVEAYTEKGEALLKQLPTDSFSLDSWKELEAISSSLSQEEELLNKASQLLIDGKVPDEFWQIIADRCIACTGCNLVCPTCTCFDVFDRTEGDAVKRYRLWDSCQLDGFMRETSGHNPMAEEKERTRRRIVHKLLTDVHRWGHITCYNCGRCDETCPSGIGIKSVCKEMIEKYADNK